MQHFVVQPDVVPVRRILISVVLSTVGWRVVNWFYSCWRRRRIYPDDRLPQSSKRCYVHLVIPYSYQILPRVGKHGRHHPLTPLPLLCGPVGMMIMLMTVGNTVARSMMSWSRTQWNESDIVLGYWDIQIWFRDRTILFRV